MKKIILFSVLIVGLLMLAGCDKPLAGKATHTSVNRDAYKSCVADSCGPEKAAAAGCMKDCAGGGVQCQQDCKKALKTGKKGKASMLAYKACRADCPTTSVGECRQTCSAESAAYGACSRDCRSQHSVTCTDEDNDNYCTEAEYEGSRRGYSGADCDDSNANVYPGAAEFCDGVDNNCDEQADEGVCSDDANCGSFGNACGEGAFCNSMNECEGVGDPAGVACGDQVCAPGQECNSRTRCEVPPFCEDDDPRVLPYSEWMTSGGDLRVLGTITNSKGFSGGPPIGPAQDECNDQGQVVQVSCNPDGTFASRQEDCPAGTRCELGACIDEGFDSPPGDDQAPPGDEQRPPGEGSRGDDVQPVVSPCPDTTDFTQCGWGPAEILCNNSANFQNRTLNTVETCPEGTTCSGPRGTAVCS